MNKETCITCGRETVSVIRTDTGFMCYNCYAEMHNPSRKKRTVKHEEADMQSEFFNKVFTVFPKLPRKLLFAVPNGGSRNKIEAVNMKRQGVTAGVADVILLVPKKGFASLCIEFKTKTGRQSEEQKEFQFQAEKCGSKYVVVRSVEQALREVKEYIE
ncbi:VRR-NUC domain-containing protein [Bacteroides heparinolyticus]|uniref:VRR-NUC domain-containing protein n=1 Tax=Prevotella heparinolytica TaxID=28113 RepID=UPI0028F08A07|nr:VRR-NUC domain-containing protein [Bacteroides heparinolyticus]